MAKATVDKWKSKKSFDIKAPALFQGKIIGSTVAYGPKELPGRVILLSLAEVSGDMNPRQQRIKLRLKIDNVLGNTATTIFLGSQIAQDFERSLTRRRTSKIYVNQDVTTKDNKKLRVKTILVTSRQINSSRKAAIRQKYVQFLDTEAKTQAMGEFIINAINGRLAPKTKKLISPIYPLRHAIIQKTEILGMAPAGPAEKAEEKPVEEPVEEKVEEVPAEEAKEEVPAEEEAPTEKKPEEEPEAAPEESAE